MPVDANWSPGDTVDYGDATKIKVLLSSQIKVFDKDHFNTIEHLRAEKWIREYPTAGKQWLQEQIHAYHEKFNKQFVFPQALRVHKEHIWDLC